MKSQIVIAAIASALILLGTAVAGADYRITRDHGGRVDAYKAKFEKIRDSRQRVIIDGICNSACTLVLGIVPLNRICVTPRASIGVHEAYLDKRWTAGLRIASASGTEDLLSYYPEPLKLWIKRRGGLKPNMQHLRNGPDLWSIIDPCPEEY